MEALSAAKPRTKRETGYAVNMAMAALGDDATKVTKQVPLEWRGKIIAAGLTNTGWNSRLSLLNQVFRFAVWPDLRAVNPAIGLRLEKSRVSSRLPFTEDEAALILNAARTETRPSLRWAHWIMAFTGMRAGEALQLRAGDVRTEGSVTYQHVNEDDPIKTVKTGERQNVPVYPALAAEEFLDYVATI